MRYLRPKSLAPEEILFSETGEPCSFLTVKLFIADCDKTPHEPASVCACDSGREGENERHSRTVPSPCMWSVA